ncbi:sodium ion-translocating decarboxylase subunit beta [Tissierella sp.]|uniref:sodium ion-translocating decarboxylase subunit beta n=1 Tax=Tissierella sp. TaxID=41274 RepID=UPI0028636C84|nr:sodium ion-translocating decarboxylase subunit beta [Tissierella sp.]MDR7856729.1 sodium ion-translocating decarboxylase subunit beta [Tissierella sp.]
MKNQRLRKLITVFTVISILLTIISIGFNCLLPNYLAFKFNFKTEEASSIGIIGGADGPTSIFLAAGQSSFYFTIIFLLLSIVGILYLSLTRKTIK